MAGNEDREMRELLIRVDEGLKSIKLEVAQLKDVVRADHLRLEARVSSLEHWRSKAEGAGWSAKVASALVGFAIAIVAGFGFQLGFVPKDKPLPHSTTQSHP
jgi:hypothetical protein